MVVNEMVGSVSYNFIDAPAGGGMAPGIPHLFTAQCVVDDQTFSGTGPSKQIAKNICAEHVIQYVVTKKCNENRNKPPVVDQQMADPNVQPSVSSILFIFRFNYLNIFDILWKNFILFGPAGFCD